MGGKAVTEVYKYTETVIYDGDGQEVARQRNWDDWWYDTQGEVDISDEELENYL